jgi:hypothetical protein
MRWKAVAASLSLLGLALVAGSYFLNTYNVGSCPGVPAAPAPFLWFGPCDHTMTAFGLTFWIRATAESAFGAGAFLVAAGVAILALAQPKGRLPSTPTEGSQT